MCCRRPRIFLRHRAVLGQFQHLNQIQRAFDTPTVPDHGAINDAMSVREIYIALRNNQLATEELLNNSPALQVDEYSDEAEEAGDDEGAEAVALDDTMASVNIHMAERVLTDESSKK